MKEKETRISISPDRVKGEHLAIETRWVGGSKCNLQKFRMSRKFHRESVKDFKKCANGSLIFQETAKLTGIGRVRDMDPHQGVRWIVISITYSSGVRSESSGDNCSRIVIEAERPVRRSRAASSVTTSVS